MDEHGVSTAALSLFGLFQWIERLPVGESLRLTRIYNDSVSERSAPPTRAALSPSPRFRSPISTRRWPSSTARWGSRA